ncbi:tRNA (N6-isopentenyl adenosine(37)-C2)-methylthiotransferase MiaB [Subsaximicrobium wynnwilliamsii]|uniref:tRNA-2-methylthio-N(6)-dimethylallyladenosine synthase n=1 Tax=Subsaximicrobium wynnwilliamsii TaxID=291179 RepID=A0A5C6ZLU6_9FLAO|nr:tRNA (N6-isopentenyl adenosine(37)-C2)-methylthiotransferase MiaB [Subsaximicrobium wynnwilliamsii]TXD84549.1 tRNA (N6-isopentenyl adenosine(37)-C2)-methylthiotransferase MiaB [Subsaximicrobium wynnwilliamsii]TXD90231.1 tRNA (N6-isopentenyl adenosine(37)-C2)-methylthiotransferase MiaB [Subsaximicrobium wynnwilliamsii]TXE04282.1 tRNA (N6-isopentenyl adenosine(37)-C2)-methylthiotransferase MiaB [Subsaximicrobium wynnwilliamsii]
MQETTKEKPIDESKQGEQLVLEQKQGNTRKLYIESYGCAMNFSDSEIVASILLNQGYNTTPHLEDADLVLVNTCSIRDKAEQTVRKRLEKYNAVKRINPKMKVGVLGCMAERLKTKFLEEEKIVDLVVGPDAYKDLPNLLAEVDEGRDAINVILSKEETYGDISPVRLNSNGVTAYVSITRGCDNMCTFCVVPFTRGRERSRNPQSIIEEVNDLWDKGYKEITLLGQNVDSYLWYGGGLKKDFVKASDLQQATAVNFAALLELCAKAQPHMRIRFSTSNPQDMTLDVIETMAKFDNICKHIHLPVQSGSDRILKAMNRLHTREQYFELIDNIKRILPECSVSQDLISGFPTETEADHQDTLSLMDYVKYNFGYMFTYSERPGTTAERKFKDDVPEETKKRRLAEIVQRQREHSEIRTKEYLNSIVEVLIEKESKKSDAQWSGRTSQNIVAVFPKEHYKVGDLVKVKVMDCTSATLIGEIAS